MKTMIFIMVAALLFSCSKDEEEEEITYLAFEQEEYQLTFGSTKSLIVQAEGVEPPFEFFSEDEEVAIIDEDGIVTAGLSGTTNISVKKLDLEDVCTVTVNPTYFLYDEPCLNFGASKQTVLDFETRGLTSNSDEKLLYHDSDDDVKTIMYMFEGGKLDAVVITFNSTYEIQSGGLTTFLYQRYKYFFYESGVFYFKRSSGLVAALSNDPIIGVNVIYFMGTPTKSAGTEFYKLKTNKIINNLVKSGQIPCK